MDNNYILNSLLFLARCLSAHKLVEAILRGFPPICPGHSHLHWWSLTKFRVSELKHLSLVHFTQRFADFGQKPRGNRKICLQFWPGQRGNGNAFDHVGKRERS